MSDPKKELERVASDALSVVTLGASNYIDKALNPNLPEPPAEPEKAPVADDAALKLSNKRKSSRRRAGGRAGTILTEGSTLG